MRDGDDRRFQDLYQYYGRVAYFFKQLGFAAEDARDLAQDVFIRVYEHMDSYRAEAKWSYLQQIARRTALNAFRDRSTKKRAGTAISETELTEISDPKVIPADRAMETEDTVQRVRRAIEQLPPDQRLCQLYALQGSSYREIGEIMGLTEAAVKSRLHQARKRLEELLGEDPKGLGDDT
jgi:RNA polymerase sigma-70 factor (ECF subfamily)